MALAFMGGRQGPLPAIGFHEDSLRLYLPGVGWNARHMGPFAGDKLLLSMFLSLTLFSSILLGS